MSCDLLSDAELVTALKEGEEVWLIPFLEKTAPKKAVFCMVEKIASSIKSLY